MDIDYMPKSSPLLGISPNCGGPTIFLYGKLDLFYPLIVNKNNFTAKNVCAWVWPAKNDLNIPHDDLD